MKVCRGAFQIGPCRKQTRESNTHELSSSAAMVSQSVVEVSLHKIVTSETVGCSVCFYLTCCSFETVESGGVFYRNCGHGNAAV